MTMELDQTFKRTNSVLLVLRPEFFPAVRALLEHVKKIRPIVRRANHPARLLFAENAFAASSKNSTSSLVYPCLIAYLAASTTSSSSS